MKRFLFFLLVFSLSLSNLQAQSDSAVAKEVEETPDTVIIGANLISLHDINFRDKEYTMRFWLWFLSKKQKFDFTSQVEVPNAKSLEKPDVLVDSVPGFYWCLMKMKATMKQSWEVHDYPFDEQYLTVRVENTVYDAGSLVFVPDYKGSSYDSELTIDGWHVKEFNVDTGATHYQTAFGFGDPATTEQSSTYSNFTINMTLVRSAWGLFFKLFMGMYIAFLISSVSFLLDPERVEPRFALPVGGLFAAVGNKYIIDSLLPESSQFTLVDALHTITFLFIFVQVAFSAISLIWVERNEHKKAVVTNKKGGYIIIGSYLLINLTLIIIALF